MTFEEAAAKAIAFREEREWGQFHNPKDLAISISLEAAELLEAFQWSGAEVSVPSKRGYIADELADVAIYCVYLAEALDIDLAQAMDEKVDKNARKYPVEKARGNSSKYTEL